jgi:DNA-binding response OmpR family regulator
MRICIIDDNVMVSDALGLVLRDAGHELLAAHGAEEGVALVNRDNPDLVVVDLDLAGSKGDVLAKLLRARHPVLPIVLCSGHQTPPPDAIGPHGADLFLAKPFTAGMLGAAFAKICARRDEAA